MTSRCDGTSGGDKGNQGGADRGIIQCGDNRVQGGVDGGKIQAEDRRNLLSTGADGLHGGTDDHQSP